MNKEEFDAEAESARPRHGTVRGNRRRISRVGSNQRHQRIHHDQGAGPELARLDPSSADLFVRLGAA
jgi:hypothetical protein